MHRRQFVAGLSVGGMASSVATASSAQTSRVLTVATNLDSPNHAAVAQDLAERVAILSGGAISIDMVPTADRAASDLHAALQSGALHAVIGAQDLWSEMSPAFGLFCSTPGGMNERELESWVQADRGQLVWDALAAVHGMKPLWLGDEGGQMLWSSVALEAADSLSGLRVATSGLASQVWQATGATILPATTSFTSDIQAYEGHALSTQLGAGDSVPAFLYLDTPTRPSAALSLSLSLSAWEGMSEAEQNLLNTSAIAVTYRANARAMQANAQAYQTLKSTIGLNIAPLPQPVWTALMDASRNVYDALADLEGEGRAAARAYTRFARDVQNWTRLSEAAFTTARARNIPA